MKIFLVIFLALATVCHAQTEGPSVGIEGRLNVLLPPPALKAKPPERNAALTLRIASAEVRGEFIQYDLRYMGLVPGNFDLRSHLLRDDGAPTSDLPPLRVMISGVLPYGHNGELNPTRDAPLAKPPSYRWLIGGAAALWALAAIPLFFIRRGRAQLVEKSATAAPPTIADRLRPLVASASTGKLSGDQQAELERLLLAHWRKRLDLENLAPAEAMPRLREHPEAGALLRALEDWLHRRPGTVKVDLETMLAPYRNTPTS